MKTILKQHHVAEFTGRSVTIESRRFVDGNQLKKLINNQAKLARDRVWLIQTLHRLY